MMHPQFSELGDINLVVAIKSDRYYQNIALAFS